MATKVKRTPAVTDDYFALVRRFPLVPIRSREQLKEAHAVIDELTRVPEDKLTRGQAEYLEVLGDLTLRYEGPLAAEELKSVAGLDLVRHLLEANGMNASDLGRLLGQRELGSKVLRGERGISKAHAKALGERFGLPGEVFLR